MNSNLERRQQIERNYHNLKYKHDTPPSTSSQSNSAYDYYQGAIAQCSIGRILDFGCGNGWVSVNLAMLGHEVHGIDISIELINKARNWAQRTGIAHRTHFQEMTGENLLFPDNFFEAVVGSAVLHHTDLEKALNGIHRVLKPGGRGIFIEPMNQNIALKFWRLLTPWRRSSAEKALTIAEIDKIMNTFPASKLKYFFLTAIFTQGLSIVFPNLQILTKMNLLCEKFDEMLIGRFPKFGKSCAVVVIELIKDEDRSGKVGVFR